MHIPTRPYFNLLKDSSRTTSTIRVITTTTTRAKYPEQREEHSSVTSEETSLNGEVLPYRSQPRCDHLLPRDASVQEAEGLCDFRFSSNEFVHDILVFVSYHRDTVVSQWLVHSTPDRAIRVRALPGDIALCSLARHITATVPLCLYPVYKKVPVNLMLGVTLRWTSILSSGELKYSYLLHATSRTAISFGLIGHLAGMQT